MKSSAMRDLMALTERDEVISLAGGLPDTSTFPPDSYAKLMQQVASESCARALQYGPTEGLEVLKRCIVEVMAAEGIVGVDTDDILVTTGGQQVIDLVCKTLIDPGDVIVADDDGVCVVHSAEAAKVAEAADKRVAMEEEKRKRLASGELGMDIYKFREKLAEMGLKYI
jgi:DNA-binding transcriptional MocR family regulator